jgi:hypothetical protein
MRCAAMAAALWLPVVAWAGPHPHFDDRGAVNWKPNFATAVAAAKQAGKPIFIQAGRDNDDASRKLVTETLADPEVSKLLRRYFVCVAFNSENAPGEIRPYFKQTGGDRPPFVVIVTERGTFLAGHSGGQSKEEVLSDLRKILEEKEALPPALEPELAKYVQALDKALEAKRYKDAGVAWAAVNKLRGYHELKDRAHDLLDEGQKEAYARLEQAFQLTVKEDYEGAKRLAEKVSRDFADLPVGEDAKEHAAALKLLETAYQAAAARKGNWKVSVAKTLSQIINRYSDTPYSYVAARWQGELAKN